MAIRTGVVRALAAAAALAAVAPVSAGSPRPAGGPASAESLRSAEDAIRAAVIERLGPDVRVTVVASGVTGSAPVFRDARPDPSGRLGGPIRFTLVTGAGAAVPVSVELTVIGDRTVALHDIARGEAVSADDLGLVHGELAGTPLKRLPAVDELAGGKARRPIPQGATVLDGFVDAPRAVEAGDRVIATVADGAVQVTAEFSAADGGDVGDVIRIVNRASRQYIRGRIVKAGMVEVVDAAR